MKKILFAMLLTACASSPPPAPEPQLSDRPQQQAAPSRFASRAECEQLVDHIDEVRFLSSRPAPSGPRSDAFRAQNQSPNWHRARVDECTISVDPHDLVCLMRSRDTTTAWRCNSRFFASTMQSYRQ